MTNKKLSDLTPEDLLDRPVWEFWIENSVEIVRPTNKTEISEISNIGHIVLTEFIINNQTKYKGFCSPQDTSGLDYIQPVIFTGNGPVNLYTEYDRTLVDKNKAVEKFGFSEQDIFQIHYKTKVKCDGKFYSGTITDFNKGT